MEFLPRQKNKNFEQRNGKLFNINREICIDDISDGYLAEEFGGGIICPICEVAQYETGCRVTHIEDGAKEVYFFNNEGKCIANTSCNRRQDRNKITIEPTNLGVFVSEFSYKDIPLFTFKKYDGTIVMRSSIFNSLFEYVEAIVERKEPDIAMSDCYESFKAALNKKEDKEK